MIRVIPRDFFNESKLLKCLGQFELFAMGNGLEIKTEFDGEPFEIRQYESNGDLYCANYKAFIGENEIELFIPYNSKERYPLIARFKGEDYYVFDSKGVFMPNFGVKI